MFQEPSTVIPRERFRKMLFDAKTFALKMLKEPVMEMHGIPEDELVKFLEQNGAEVISVLPDYSAGKVWRSFMYFAIKN